MSRTRSFSLHRLTNHLISHLDGGSADDDDDDVKDVHAAMSPYHHSRDSSANSIISSPLASTFQSHDHNRHLSSSSSLATNADSPSTAPTSRTTLHDLLEDPAERDGFYWEDFNASANEPLCICDTTFCEHRQEPQPPSVAVLTSSEWPPEDDYFSDDVLHRDSHAKRRRSGDFVSDTFGSRLSRHFPSMKRRSYRHRASASLSGTSRHSNPPSRSSSFRSSGHRSVTLPVMPTMLPDLTPFPSAGWSVKERSISPLRVGPPSYCPSPPAEMEMPAVQEEPIDRENLSSTPLLPPMMAAHYDQVSKPVASPLQSPTVATSAAVSMATSPVGTPVLPGCPTPPPSARASMASLPNAQSTHTANVLGEIPPLAIAEETDPWAIKLGHANFHITPEPYLPQACNRETCQRLQDDWGAAQVEYMRHIGRISLHYGATSEIYKLTREKWHETNERWRLFHRQANEKAQETGDMLPFLPLPDVLPISKMPSLSDPQNPSKFPVIDEQDIVGPMVCYAETQHEQRKSKKPSLRKIFTDPASLLSSRSSLHR